MGALYGELLARTQRVQPVSDSEHRERDQLRLSDHAATPDLRFSAVRVCGRGNDGLQADRRRWRKGAAPISRNLLLQRWPAEGCAHQLRRACFIPGELLPRAGLRSELSDHQAAHNHASADHWLLPPFLVRSKTS